MFLFVPPLPFLFKNCVYLFLCLLFHHPNHNPHCQSAIFSNTNGLTSCEFPPLPFPNSQLSVWLKFCSPAEWIGENARQTFLVVSDTKRLGKICFCPCLMDSPCTCQQACSPSSTFGGTSTFPGGALKWMETQPFPHKPQERFWNPFAKPKCLQHSYLFI